MDEVYQQTSEFLQHQYIKINQAKTSQHLVEISSDENSDTAVVSCDFAEKFKCVQQNSTQSAFYGQTTVNLFTVAVYHRSIKSIAIASDFEKNTKECVVSYMDIILQELPVTVKNVYIWSDIDATSQFKNQYIMEALKTFEDRYPRLKIW